MITMHASHKQDPASVLQIIETLLIENYSVNLQLNCKKAVREIVSEMKSQNFPAEITIHKQSVFISPKEKCHANNTA